MARRSRSKASSVKGARSRVSQPCACGASRLRQQSHAGDKALRRLASEGYPQERAGRLPREVVAAREDEHARPRRPLGERDVVLARLERHPGVHAAARPRGGDPELRAHRRQQRVAALAQLHPGAAQMARPARRGDELNRRLLQRAGHERALHEPGRPQPRGGRAARHDRAQAQARRGRLGQRAQVDDVAVAVAVQERRRRLALEREVAERVVLDHEGAGVARHLEHLAPALGREHGAVRVRVGRLAVEGPRAAGREGVGQQVGTDAVGVAGHRQRPQPGGAGGRHRAGIGRRLDEHRRARRRQRAQAGGERGLAAEADDHVVLPHPAPDLGGEPRAQRRDPLERHPVPRAGPSRGARQRLRERAERLQVGRQVAGAEHEHAGLGRAQQLVEPARRERARAERDGLPAEVGRLRRSRPRRHERAAPGPRLEQPAGGEQRDRALHGDRPDVVAGHQLAHGRQPRAGLELGGVAL